MFSDVLRSSAIETGPRHCAGTPFALSRPPISRLKRLPAPRIPSHISLMDFHVDPDITRASTPPSAVYHDAQAYALQRERIFTRSWQPGLLRTG